MAIYISTYFVDDLYHRLRRNMTGLYCMYLVKDHRLRDLHRIVLKISYLFFPKGLWSGKCIQTYLLTQLRREHELWLKQYVDS